MADANTIDKIIALDPCLKYKYKGCFSCDNFPSSGYNNSFSIINTAPKNHQGEHWVLIAGKRGQVVFYDSFGRHFPTYFPNIFQRVDAGDKQLVQLFPTASFVQHPDSYLCGIYCVFVAHHIYNRSLASFPHFATEEDIINFWTNNFTVTRELL